jgi:2-oxo-4-hydroxy-4-carboxy-5-ureidoimidazoline decarboxylase
MKLSELNDLSTDEAKRVFRECCGSSRWATRMTEMRPFESREVLLAAADEVWNSLGPDDWREAFAHHPRIGERATGTAAGEQSGMRSADEKLRDEFAKANREYEERFGYIYIVCATGKSGPEMLEIVQRRLVNDPEDELKVAAEEQRKITRIRLTNLVQE